MAAQLQSLHGDINGAVLLTEFIEPCRVVSWYEMAVVEDFGPLSERKTKADASNSAVMVERAKTRLHSMAAFLFYIRQTFVLAYTTFAIGHRSNFFPAWKFNKFVQYVEQFLVTFLVLSLMD